MTKLFYTYVHTRNDTGEVFYVGKGHGDRAKQTDGRNHYWHKIVKKHGHFVTIMREFGPDEAAAFAHEVYLIKVMREAGIKLVNMTDGGEGPSGRVPDSRQLNKLKNTWANPTLLEKVRETSFAQYKDPTQREKAKQANLKAWEDPNLRQRMSDIKTALYADPAQRERMREIQVARWADLELRKRMSDIQKRGSANRKGSSAASSPSGNPSVPGHPT